MGQAPPNFSRAVRDVATLAVTLGIGGQPNATQMILNVHDESYHAVLRSELLSIALVTSSTAFIGSYLC